MRRKTNFIESAISNNRNYINYINRLTEIAISMFKWENLPDTVDERYLELTLFQEGRALFFKDEEIGFLALKSVNNGLNVYGIPTKRKGIGANGYNSPLLNSKNSVLVYNNYLHQNTYPMVEIFAKRLYDLDRIIEVNCRAQKTPVLVRATEKQRLTMKNLYKEYDGNSPVIFGDKDLDVNNLTSISTQAPYVSDKIYALKRAYWDEALTYLGITSTPFEKKERLITAEMENSQGSNNAYRHSRLEARKRASEEINRIFGLNINVEFRDNINESLTKEGNIDEQIHNAIKIHN